ncbi:MAG: hypothetical protein K2O15_05910 [Lachnospiraceae bacterium]|nr:hypothetical protein [Lachnospiraceae bacterium]
MFTEYYGMGFNPFNKQNLKEKDAFPSEDHRQMQERPVPFLHISVLLRDFCFRNNELVSSAFDLNRIAY